MAEPKRGRGQPPKIDQELADEIANYLIQGNYLETAAAMVGIDRHTLTTWAKRGAREKQRRAKHKATLEEEKENDKTRVRKIRREERERRAKRAKEHRATTRKEQIYVDFHSTIKAAIAKAEAEDLECITKAAKGGHLIERTEVTNPDGTVTITEKRARPQWQAAAWKRERSNPKKWGQIRRVEVSGDREAPVAMTLADAIAKARMGERNQETPTGEPEDGGEGID